MSNLAFASTSLRDDLEALHPESFGWALACCDGRRDDAEDALHQSYLKVLAGQARFGGRSSFKTWFFGVVRLTALELRRRNRWQRVLTLDILRDDPPTADEDPERDVTSKQNAERLRQALRRLSGRQRQVLHLVFYQDLTLDEASTVVDLPIGTVRTHYERGKKRLRQILAEETL